MGKRIAALFVETDGIYSTLEGVDPWDVVRDARSYAGPDPVVAHPPCERWGRYWSGGPSAKRRRLLGDDGGCFAAALYAVRHFGGVLEHPEASHAWRWFGLERPARAGGWTEPDAYGGRSCCVEQGHYGHPARKATWLYAVLPFYPILTWGPCESRVRLDAGFHSAEERAEAKRLGNDKPVERLSKRQRLATPRPFAEMLVDMVRTMAPPECGHSACRQNWIETGEGGAVCRRENV